MVNPPAEARRLGRRQLGRHAYEEHMPQRVFAVASQETGKNRLAGIIPLLVGLLEGDDRVKSAHLCNPAIQQIYRTKEEGDHFCCYRNLQMLLSCGSGDSTRTSAKAKYSIIELQLLIEEAWAAGINSNGLIETGGIKNTRKHIGTSEAQALLQHLGRAGQARAFSNITGSKTAYIDLLDYVQEYFSRSSDTCTDSTTKARCTVLPPIYLQRPRHSLTIVGLELRHDGSRSLLVFDPGYEAPSAVRKLSPDFGNLKDSRGVLKAYRRNERYLKRYRAFETLEMAV